MKTKVIREEKEFKPIELNITLETREEEIFWISILNSSYTTWEEVYMKGAGTLRNISVLSKANCFKAAHCMADLFHKLTAQSTEDTSDD